MILTCSLQDLFDTLPNDLNYNVTGWLTYNDKAAFPEPATVDEFDIFDDWTLVPHDQTPVFGKPDQEISLDVIMDNLGDGAN
jgi:iron transport multicopper oxidase